MIDGLAPASATWGIKAFPAKTAPRHTMHRAVCATPSWYGVTSTLPHLPAVRLLKFVPRSILAFFYNIIGCLKRNSNGAILLVRSFRRVDNPRKLTSPNALCVGAVLLSFLVPFLPCYAARIQLCPGDCSGAGTCHHSNGTCSCLPHRVGDDCSEPYCSSMFSSRCAQCTFEGCTSCQSGYYVDHAGGGFECLSCDRYDPRCTR